MRYLLRIQQYLVNTTYNKFLMSSWYQGMLILYLFGRNESSANKKIKMKIPWNMSQPFLFFLYQSNWRAFCKRWPSPFTWRKVHPEPGNLTSGLSSFERFSSFGNIGWIFARKLVTLLHLISEENLINHHSNNRPLFRPPFELQTILHQAGLEKWNNGLVCYSDSISLKHLLLAALGQSIAK